MSLDYLSLGPVPSGEDCAQVGADDYHTQAKKECRAYIAQLTRQKGAPPVGATLAIKANAHDFGTYLDVVCWYDSGNAQATEYALACEDGPEEWDDDARKQLGL